MAIAGTVVSGLSYLTNKALAQTPSLNQSLNNIVGITSGSIITTDKAVIPEVNTTELDSTAPNNVSTDIKPVGLVLQSLTTGNSQVLANSTPLAEPGEILI